MGVHGGCVFLADSRAGFGVFIRALHVLIPDFYGKRLGEGEGVVFNLFFPGANDEYDILYRSYVYNCYYLSVDAVLLVWKRVDFGCKLGRRRAGGRGILRKIWRALGSFFFNLVPPAFL